MAQQQLGILLKINADTKDGQAALASIGKQLKGLSDSAKTGSSGMVESLKKAGREVNELGGRLMGGVLVGGMATAGAAIAVGIKNLAEFDDQMVSVRKTTGMSVEEIAGLGDSLREMASAGGSLSGVTAMELGKIAEVAGQLGINGKQNILDFSNTIAEMTIATGMSAEAAASGMASIGNTYRDSLTQNGQTVAEQMDNIGSSFDALEDATNASASSLIDMTGKMGGAATQLGLSVSEVAGISATLADRGVEVEVAGTAMSKFFADILVNSKDWAAAMKLDSKEFAEALKNDPMEAVQMVAEGMSELKKNDGPAALMATLEDLGVSDTRLQGALLKLGDAHLDLEKNVNTANTAFEDGTRLHQSASIAAESSVKQYDLLKERAVEASRGVGELFEPMTTAALKFGNEGLKAAIEGLGEIKTNGADVGNLFGEAFGIDDLGTRFSDAFQAVTGTFEELSANTNGFVEELKAQFTFPNLWDTAKTQTGDFLGWTVDAFRNIQLPGAIKPIGEAWDETVAGLKTEWDGFTQMLSASGAAIKDAIVGPFIEAKEKVKGAMDDIKSAVGMDTAPKLDFGAQDALTQLSQLKDAIGGFTAEQSKIEQQYKVVWGGMKTAIEDNREPSDNLKQRFVALQEEMLKVGNIAHSDVFPNMTSAIATSQSSTQSLSDDMTALREEIKGVGIEAYKNSTFPDMTAAIQTSGGATTELTAKMEGVRASVKQLEADYKAANQSDKAASDAKKQSVDALTAQIDVMKAHTGDYWGLERDSHEENIKALERQRDAAKSVSASRKGDIEAIKEKLDQEKDKLKELEQAERELEKAEKARVAAVEVLADNTQRTGELRQQQIEDEQRAENELYRERQQQAADSLKWVGQLDDATKKRLMGEEDAVKVLQAQGIELTDLQAQELRRMQAAYQTEAAYEAQVKALQAQLDPMGALMAAGDKLSSSLGGLSSGISDIGGLFNIDTSGITDILSKVQGLAELPSKIGGIFDSIKGIGGGLGGIGSSVSGLLGGLGGGLSGLLAGIGPALGGIAAAAGPVVLAGAAIYGAWKLIGPLFEDTKSKGTEAAEGFQEFVGKNISGGAELEAALKTNFDAMGKAGFDFQTFLQQTGTTMDQTFGGISASWQTGGTAMDLFTQAIVKSGVEVSKAPQQALQMMAAFQDMGLSAEQAGEKMMEIATKAGMSAEEIEKLKSALAAGGEEGEAAGSIFDANTMSVDNLNTKVNELSSSLDATTDKLAGTGKEGLSTSNVFTSTRDSASGLQQDVDTLGSALGGVQSQFGGATEQAGAFARSLKDVASEASAVSSVRVQSFASGGFPSGLAMVNERGNEIANIPGFGMALMQSRGAVLGAFPSGTEIIPHDKSMRLMRDYPTIPRIMPGYATGGTVEAAAKANDGKTVNITNQITIQMPASARFIDRSALEQFTRQLLPEIERQQRLMVGA